uniref:CUB domain-containing protein n=1 Tax=Bursaphelenchus xylophilus TaxID=6326 RepID=A0A1I7RZJ8_BURXY
MRVGGAHKSFVLALIALCLTVSHAKRTKKAGSKTLQRINSLINEHINKTLPQFDTPSLPPPKLNPNARRHPDELSVNDPEDFFQGDVELSDRQATIIEQDLLEKLGRANARRKRKVGRESVYKRWDTKRPISYEFAESIPEPTKQRIREALGLWERNTCIRFLENGPDVDRLEFYDGGGCSSFVGRAGGTQINKAYKCTEHCPPINCKNGGYPNPHNCKKCKCPVGLAGARCADVQFSVCGGALKASTNKLQIQSPNYPLPFPQGMDCNWLIRAPKGGKIYLQFVDEFNFECIDTCDASYVEVKLKKDFRMTGYRFCCSQAPSQTLVADSEQMVVLHRGMGQVSAGFRALIWSDKDPDESEKSQITSTSRPLFTLPFTTTMRTTTTTAEPERPIETTRGMEKIEEVEFKPEIVQPTRFRTSPPLFTTTTTTLRPTTATTTTTEPPLTEIYEKKTTISLLPGEIDQFLGGALGPDENLEKIDEENEKEKEFTLFPTLLPTFPNVFGMTTVPPSSVEVHSTETPEEVTAPDGAECACGPWSEWIAPCTQMCGGCGKRTRTRPCRSEKCRREEKRTCNFDVCPKGTNFLWTNGEFHFLFDGCCFGSFNNGNGVCSGIEQEKNGGVVQLLLNLLKAGDEPDGTKRRTFVPD